MPVMMQVVGGHANSANVGQFLKSIDFETHQGRGHVAFTSDVNAAMQFPSHSATLEFYRTQSKTHPTRPDDKPNRPLTAISMLFVEPKDINDR